MQCNGVHALTIKYIPALLHQISGAEAIPCIELATKVGNIASQYIQNPSPVMQMQCGMMRVQDGFIIS